MERGGSFYNGIQILNWSTESKYMSVKELHMNILPRDVNQPLFAFCVA